ncbi:MAG: 30S ribosomal protein S9 [Parcubacteria group bacterium]
MPDGEYFYAVGKRKTSIAQVRIYLASKAPQGVVVNGRNLDKYFTLERLQATVSAPLVAVGQEGKTDVIVKVVGGGITGQAEAARLGIARALVKFDNTYKKTLRDLGFMTRDSRIVERKKPGLKKARRAPQWAKR